MLLGISLNGIWNFGGLDVESLEMVGVGFEIFDFSVDKSWQLSVKSWAFDLKDAFIKFVLWSLVEALEGDFLRMGVVIFLLDEF